MSTFNKADILIPKNCDFKKWSVVACDQYTSEPEYWEDVSDIVGDAPSTLELIFPEVYLSQGDDRIKKINNAMERYIKDGIFEEYKNSLFYIERSVSGGRIRKGIIGCIDLEDYDYKEGSKTNVRATEKTVIERIPPRVKIRKNASLELPHVMILIDDEKKDIIESLSEKKNGFKMIYDFDLMKNGGHITGYVIDEKSADNVLAGLSALEKEFFNKYGKETPLLTFAVGDGNHSLATAKKCWEDIKPSLSEEEIKDHPARFALCEIVNVHDDAIVFEPIHRVIFNTDPDDLISALYKYYDISENDTSCQGFEYITSKERKKLYIKNPKSDLSVGSIQAFLDDYLASHKGTADYIHGEDVVIRLGSGEGNIGFILPAMKKSDLFGAVIKDGALVRKTFSMGEASDKRFYLEAKKIK